MTRNQSLIVALLVLFIVVPTGWMIFGASGCSGRANETEEERAEREKTEAEERKEEEAEKEKEKPPFEPLRVTVLPGMLPYEQEEEDTVDGTQEPEEELDEDESTLIGEPQGLRRVAVKPGHWVYARYETTANNYDFSGRLTVECTDSSLNAIDLEKSPFRCTSSRPVVFPKGQQKAAELPVFVSVPPSGKKNVQLHAMLTPRGGRYATQDFTPTLRLKSHQYHIVVLAGESDKYGYVRSLDSIKPPPPRGREMMNGLPEDYIVTLHGLGENESLLLPGNPLAWTSIAYLIWDDIPPDSLAPDQQLALVDWLHWGGQIIVSGPRTLDQLRGSFLGDYLPATSDRTAKATEEDMAALNRRWSLLPNESSLDQSTYVLASTAERPIEIAPLTPTPGSTAMPDTGGLVVERKVGRGRIVVTAFSLSSRPVVNWQNFDGFFNGCLLRRPGRTYGDDNGDQFKATWVAWRNNSNVPFSEDPRLNCGLRYFTRDAMMPGEGRNSTRSNTRRVPSATVQPVADEPTSGNSQLATDWGLNWNPLARSGGTRGIPGTHNNKDIGVAGWSDFTSAANKARSSLLRAAGIDVPDAGFVAKVLAGYLVCLVPLNWLFFRLLRRVEWAWFAAPVIAIAGAMAIIRLAQLDIGFVRSRTEIAILEMQPDYERGHLTRYCGLYTSLGTDYGFEFEDSNAVGMPFSTDPDVDQLALQKQRRRAVPFVRDTKVSVSDYPVISNSTGMVHVEQMVDLPGQIEFLDRDSVQPKLRNGMDLDLKCAVAMHILEDGTGIGIMPLGDLAPGDEVTLSTNKTNDVDPLLTQLGENPVTAARSADGEVNLRELMRLGLHPSSGRPGSWRLVGWTDQPIEGMKINPQANQNLYRTLFVCHLDHGRLPKPGVDTNHIVDYKADDEDDFGEDFDDDTPIR